MWILFYLKDGQSPYRVNDQVITLKTQLIEMKYQFINSNDGLEPSMKLWIKNE